MCIIESLKITLLQILKMCTKDIQFPLSMHCNKFFAVVTVVSGRHNEACGLGIILVAMYFCTVKLCITIYVLLYNDNSKKY